MISGFAGQEKECCILLYNLYCKGVAQLYLWGFNINTIYIQVFWILMQATRILRQVRGDRFSILPNSFYLNSYFVDPNIQMCPFQI